MIKRYAKDGHELIEWRDGNWVKYDDIVRLAYTASELLKALIITEKMLCEQENAMRTLGCYEPCPEIAILTAQSAIAEATDNDMYTEEKTLEQHRKEFEGWAEPSGLSIATSFINDDSYANGDTEHAWEAWKAARGII